MQESEPLHSMEVRVFFSRGKLRAYVELNGRKIKNVHDLEIDPESDARLYALSQIIRSVKPAMDQMFQEISGITRDPVGCGKKTEQAAW